MDCCEEVAGGLIVACGNRSELLDLSEEVFDQMASPEQLPIVIS